jgi:mannose PTS system EIIC component
MELWAVLALIGGIVSMDTTSGPQVMISEPLVSCTLVGLLFGMPATGLLLGIVFQLQWFDYMPLGAVRFTDHNMAAFIATASLLMAGTVYGTGGHFLQKGVIPAILFGVFVGYLGLQTTAYIWRRNDRVGEHLVKAIQDGRTSDVVRVHLMGIGMPFLKGVLMTILFIPAGTFVCGLVRHIPARLDDAFTLGSLMIFGTVAASAIHFHWLNAGKRRALLIGSIGGAAFLYLSFVI